MQSPVAALPSPKAKSKMNYNDLLKDLNHDLTVDEPAWQRRRRVGVRNQIANVHPGPRVLEAGHFEAAGDSPTSRAARHAAGLYAQPASMGHQSLNVSSDQDGGRRGGITHASSNALPRTSKSFSKQAEARDVLATLDQEMQADTATSKRGPVLNRQSTGPPLGCESFEQEALPLATDAVLQSMALSQAAKSAAINSTHKSSGVNGSRKPPVGGQSALHMPDEGGSSIEGYLAQTEEIRAMTEHLRAKTAGRGGFVIIPDNHMVFFAYYDILMALCLFFVCYVTPYEVVFTTDSPVTVLFWVNRVVDIFFLADMFLNFTLAYVETTPSGFRWVMDSRLITKHYLRTWFLIDLCSILPFWILTLEADEESAENLKSTKVFRIIRLLRLFKLARVLRANRLIRRWQTSFPLSPLRITQVKLVFLLTIVSEWLGCALGLIGLELRDPENGVLTWIDNVQLQDAPPTDQFITACYWAVVTITSVGYGDIVPRSVTERGIIIFILIASGLVWAMVLSELVDVFQNEHNKRQRQLLADINFMVAEKQLSGELARRIRAHALSHRDQSKLEYAALIERLPPALQECIAMEFYREHLTSCHLFAFVFESGGESNEGQYLLPGLMARGLKQRLFNQGENVQDLQTLHLVTRGTVVRHPHILPTGEAFGFDFCLEHAYEFGTALALTMAELALLDSEAINQIEASTMRVKVEQELIKRVRRNCTVFCGITWIRNLAVKLVKQFKRPIILATSLEENNPKALNLTRAMYIRSARAASYFDNGFPEAWLRVLKDATSEDLVVVDDWIDVRSTVFNVKVRTNEVVHVRAEALWKYGESESVAISSEMQHNVSQQHSAMVQPPGAANAPTSKGATSI